MAQLNFRVSDDLKQRMEAASADVPRGRWTAVVTTAIENELTRLEKMTVATTTLEKARAALQADTSHHDAIREAARESAEDRINEGELDGRQMRAIAGLVRDFGDHRDITLVEAFNGTHSEIADHSDILRWIVRPCGLDEDDDDGMAVAVEAFLERIAEIVDEAL